jgi:ribosome-binding protein aMBF1 (putative translation factor)
LNQDDLAKKLGVVKSAICQWETGQTSPKKEFHKHLSTALGISSRSFRKWIIWKR